MGRKQRLDSLLVERGLAPSRERARALILAGAVEVEDRRDLKPGSAVGADAEIRVLRDPNPYVSRGGLKLAHALEAFGLRAEGLVCLDAGASTGGFTHCLLEAGAARVIALDVGRGQLDWRLRTDPRVVVLEGKNVRDLVPEDLPEAPDLAAVDVSFISLRLALPPVAAVLKPPGWILALVKPQFEVGKGRVEKGGLVRDPAKHLEVLSGLIGFCRDRGLRVAGLTASPITGAKGNIEYFLCLGLPPAGGEGAFPGAEEVRRVVEEAVGRLSRGRAGRSKPRARA
ncbi:MAG: TlyA family RNA methyltransferase [Candidatus Tectomicrobia bacterium]|nr:TlyA family RNA methyltransferase [Candidatus Tectomicrobia bacterium]